eukprot:COSAG05_NODE_422_length_9952_cov_41.878336_3_plen_92_part_00
MVLAQSCCPHTPPEADCFSASVTDIVAPRTRRAAVDSSSSSPPPVVVVRAWPARGSAEGAGQSNRAERVMRKLFDDSLVGYGRMAWVQQRR